MKIGELAARTGVTNRLLRYYEEQGLLAPDRTANGYRDYPESLVGRVAQIRSLLDSGVPTRIIALILPCLADPCTVRVTDASPELVATLEEHRARMDARIACLTRNRDAIDRYLDGLATPPRRSGREPAGTPATARPRPGSDGPAPR